MKTQRVYFKKIPVGRFKNALKNLHQESRIKKLFASLCLVMNYPYDSQISPAILVVTLPPVGQNNLVGSKTKTLKNRLMTIYLHCVENSSTLDRKQMKSHQIIGINTKIVKKL